MFWVPSEFISCWIKVAICLTSFLLLIPSPLVNLSLIKTSNSADFINCFFSPARISFKSLKQDLYLVWGLSSSSLFVHIILIIIKHEISMRINIRFFKKFCWLDFSFRINFSLAWLKSFWFLHHLLISLFLVKLWRVFNFDGKVLRILMFLKFIWFWIKRIRVFEFIHVLYVHILYWYKIFAKVH